MSKKVIWFIIILMTIALVGLISLQTFWIHQEFKLKEEQFNRQITDVFNAINEELDAKETVLEVSNEAFSLKYKIEDFPSKSLFGNRAVDIHDKNALSVRKNFSA